MFFIQYKYKNGHKHLFCPIDNQSVSFQGSIMKLIKTAPSVEDAVYSFMKRLRQNSTVRVVLSASLTVTLRPSLETFSDLTGLSSASVNPLPSSSIFFHSWSVA